MNTVNPNGNATLVAGGAIKRGEILKFSSGKVVPCSADTDAAIGVALDAAANGEIVPVAILGSYTGTVLVLAAGAISQGAAVNPVGTAAEKGDLVIGRALTAATAANDVIEVAHCVAGYHIDNDTNT